MPRRSASSASRVALRSWQRSRARSRAATSSGSSGSYISPASIFWRSVGTGKNVSSVTRGGPVIVTFVALNQKEPVVWVSYLPLPPLALLLFTGLYLFVLPYSTKWRGERRTD